MVAFPHLLGRHIVTFLAFLAPLHGVFARVDADVNTDVDTDVNTDVDTDQVYQKEYRFP
jgi:hypothetical protein